MNPLNNPMKLLKAFLILAVALTTAQAYAGLPTDQIKSTVDKAVLVLRDPRLKPAAKQTERREQLKQVLFGRFNFTEMAKRSLGLPTQGQVGATVWSESKRGSVVDSSAR